MNQSSSSTRILLTLLALSVSAAAAAGALGEFPEAQPPEVPRNVELADDAWSAFKHQDYEGAIKAAQHCVRRFKSEADGQQADLLSQHAPPLPVGRVSEKIKQAAFAQGVLNDVATCMWIEASSAAMLHRDDEAKELYKAVKAYSYARTWDPRGWLWSPSEDATDRLLDFK